MFISDPKDKHIELGVNVLNLDVNVQLGNLLKTHSKFSNFLLNPLIPLHTLIQPLKNQKGQWWF